MAHLTITMEFIMLSNNQRFIQVSESLVEFYNLLDAWNDGDIELSQDELNFINLGIDSLCLERFQLRATLMDFPRPSANFFHI